MFIFSLISDSDTVHKESLITPWTYIHFLSGIIATTIMCKWVGFGYSRKDVFIIGMLTHSVYELNDLAYYFHNINRDGAHPSKKEPEPESAYVWKNNSPINSFGDTIAYALGAFTAFKLSIVNQQLIGALFAAYAFKAGLFKYYFNYD